LHYICTHIETDIFSKVMNKTKTEAIKASIKAKIERGDFVKLAKVLEIPVGTAKQRFNRNNEQAVFIMAKIKLHQERMIDRIKKQLETQGKEVISIKIIYQKK